MSLRVMTYNIRGTKGMDDQRNMERIVETVRGADPDIVCFQEVHQRFPGGDTADEPAELRRLLGGHIAFQRNINLIIGGYGIAVWAKTPFRTVTKHFLPSGKERRGLLTVYAHTVLGEIAVCCTHWGLNETERVRQAETAVEIVSKITVPVILAGDFNETAEGQAMQVLINGGKLTDAGKNENLPTYSADRPEHRIDYLLHTAELQASGLIVIPSLASDHRPLVADFTI